MRNLFTFLVIFLPLNQTVPAASTLTRPGGMEYRFGDWSDVEMVSVPWEKGEVQLQKQSCVVAIHNAQLPQQAPREVVLDLLTDASGKTVWIGHKQERYFLISGKIYGASVEGFGLQIRQTQALKQEMQDTSALIGQVFSRFADAPASFHSLDTAAYAFDLRFIFTFDGIYRKGISRPWGVYAKVTDVQVEPTTITLKLEGLVSKELQVVFSHSFDVLSASIGGKPILALLDGKLPRVLPEWSPAREISVPSAGGPVKGLSFSRLFERENVRATLFSDGARAVVLNTGHVWIGSDNCRLALCGDRLLGVGLGTNKMLRVYAGSRTKVPVPSGGKRAFEEELTGFEAAVEAGTFRADYSVSLPSVFPDDSRVPGAETLLRGVWSNESGLVISIGMTEYGMELKIHLRPDLTIASVEKVRTR